MLDWKMQGRGWGRGGRAAYVLGGELSHPPLWKSSHFYSAVPSPAVVITSTPVSPIRPINTTVTLTCAVDLNPLVDIPVTVTAQISPPLSVIITSVTNSVMENTTRYTSTATVSPFGRETSGEYTCTANIELVTSNSFIIGGTGVTGMDRITVGTGKLY